jgi:hypothetical protein
MVRKVFCICIYCICFPEIFTVRMCDVCCHVGLTCIYVHILEHSDFDLIFENCYVSRNFGLAKDI